MGGSCDDLLVEKAGATETVKEQTGGFVGTPVGGGGDTIRDEDTVGKLVGEGVGCRCGHAVRES